MKAIGKQNYEIVSAATMLVFVSFVSPHYQEILTEKYGHPDTRLFVRLSLLWKLTKTFKFRPKLDLIKAESNIIWFLDSVLLFLGS